MELKTTGTEVHIPADGVTLEGNLTLPEGTRGVVLFAHGSGSSRHSPRNQAVARVLQQAGLGTLLMDLLTRQEEQEEAVSRHHRFNIQLLADRLSAACDWVRRHPETGNLGIGLFGASTGAAAALVAAARRRGDVAAVVSRGGRPDLAGEFLPHVQAPTLLIVGSSDLPVIPLNEAAAERLHCGKELVLVPGATHLFEEPGTLDEVARLACGWFCRYLPCSGQAKTGQE